VRYAIDESTELADIGNTPIQTPDRRQIPLSAVATLQEDRGPNFVMRENAQRRIVVQSNVSRRDLRSVVNGNMTLTANTAGTNPDPTSGILVSNAVLTTTGTGNISLTGRGGNNAFSGNHRGVLVVSGADITSTSAAVGAGTITLDGTAGTGTTGLIGVALFERHRLTSLVMATPAPFRGWPQPWCVNNDMKEQAPTPYGEDCILGITLTHS